jgi:hypothetical protein
LLVPTIQISGIESPIVRGPNATNYFANAWEARTHIDDVLHLTLPRDDIGLAINSVVSRSQDQLHIHFSCIRADVWETLHEHERDIGNQWGQGEGWIAKYPCTSADTRLAGALTFIAVIEMGAVIHRPPFSLECLCSCWRSLPRLHAPAFHNATWRERARRVAHLPGVRPRM